MNRCHSHSVIHGGPDSAPQTLRQLEFSLDLKELTSAKFLGSPNPILTEILHKSFPSVAKNSGFLHRDL